MATAEVSVYPFALAIGMAMVAFAVLVPWLVHESRRPLRVHVPRRHEPRPHTVLPAVALCVRAVAASLSPARVRPEPAEAAARWRHAFADQLERAATRTVPPTTRPTPRPEARTTPYRVRPRSASTPEPRALRARRPAKAAVALRTSTKRPPLAASGAGNAGRARPSRPRPRSHV